MGTGYIGVTDRKWYEHLKGMYQIDEVNFWRKNTNNFRSINAGDKFFFLVKNKKGVKEERKVLGYGIFDRFEVLSIDEAWKKYKQGNGVVSRDEFINRMSKIYDDNLSNSLIGCIILRDITFFNKEVILSGIGIEFQNGIVSGKGITEEEVNKILFTKDQLIDIDRVMEESEEYYLEVNEGNKQLLYHYRIERDRNIIKKAKDNFKVKNGGVFCEICGFDFQKEYGEVGIDFIEGHHDIPLSKYKKGQKTKLSDIKMVCSNCHSIIHRSGLTIIELQELIKKRKF